MKPEKNIELDLSQKLNFNYTDLWGEKNLTLKLFGAGKILLKYFQMNQHFPLET